MTLSDKPLYYCTHCRSLVRETDDYGEFLAGKCRDASYMASVREKWRRVREGGK